MGLAPLRTMLSDATLADGSRVDVYLTGDRITDVVPPGRGRPGPCDMVHDLSSHLLLAAPAEPHAHLDKALTADVVPNDAGDLMSAVAAWQAHAADLDMEEIADRARRAALMGLANGATAVRTHVDLWPALGTRAVEALVAVREELADVLDLQVVPLPVMALAGPAHAASRRLLEEALDVGCDAVGGVPQLDHDVVGAIDVCVRLAATRRLPVDLHLDEHLDATALHLPDMARLVGSIGVAGTPVASHCVSLGLQPPEVQREVAAMVAAAGIGVVTLPVTNLSLLARGKHTAPPRGLTAVRALLDAGVVVAAGGDNLRDPFNPIGRADTLEAAATLVVAGHVSIEEAWRAVSESARAVMGLPVVKVAPGYPAELLAVRGSSLRDVVAGACADRLVFHRGRLVSRTRLVQDVGGMRSVDAVGPARMPA